MGKEFNLRSKLSVTYDFIRNGFIMFGPFELECHEFSVKKKDFFSEKCVAN